MDNTASSISLTQRIVGAIVVLSLAIIFIPVFLETDHLDPGKLVESPIPEVPREISTIVFQLNEINGKFENNEFTASTELTKEVSKAIENSASEVEVADDTTSLKTPAKEKPAQASLTLDEKEKHSWMLQLASFKEEGNAYKLRDSLRKKQYVANVNERKLSNGSIWRVRVGPVLHKTKILKIQAALEKEFAMKGLIIRRR